MRGGIFISYRRKHAKDFAGRLGDFLVARSDAEWVFLDVEIRPGADFMAVIRESIARTGVFLIIIDPSWHRWAERRRLEKPHDPVRVEIEAALDQTVPIIPVLMNGTSMPTADKLPGRLSRLAGLHAVDVSSETFHADVERLLNAISEERTAPGTGAAAGSSAVADPPTSLAASAYRGLQRFATDRQGYAVEHVNATLEDVITRMSDPERCLDLRAPFFELARGRSTGYDRAQVDTFVRRHRPPAKSFAEALRRLLAERSVLLDSAGGESADLVALRRRLGMGSDERYLAVIQLRVGFRGHPESWLAFTDRRLRVGTPGHVFDVPYTDLGEFSATSTERTESVSMGYDNVATSTSSTLTIRYRDRYVTLAEAGDGRHLDGLVTRLVADAKELRPDR